MNIFLRTKEGTIIGHLPTVQIIPVPEVGIPEPEVDIPEPEVDIPEVNIPEPAENLEEIPIIVLKKVIPNIVPENLNIILIKFPVFPEVQGTGGIFLHFYFLRKTKQKNGGCCF